MFNHCPPTELEELLTETKSGRRHYIVGKNSYPSITSILGAFPKPGIEKWRKRVGEEEANRITKRSTQKGTNVHAIIEDYLNNKEIKTDNYFALENFNSVKPYLNQINNIHYLECPLYSNQLKVAGRCDSIAEFDGTLSIIDFKTSRKLKREEWIQDYFFQCSFYSAAYYELTKIKAKQIVIIMAVENEEPQLFKKEVKDYLKPTISKIRKYYELYHHK